MKNMRRLNILMAGMISATGLFVALRTSVEATEYQAKKAFDGALQPLVSPQSIGKGKSRHRSDFFGMEEWKVCSNKRFKQRRGCSR